MSNSNFDMVTHDDDLLPVKEASDEKTVLDSLRNELAREIKNDPITLTIPSRNTMSLIIDTNIESGTLQMWRKQSQNKSMVDNFDGLKFSSIVIANQAKEVKYEGEIIVDEAGELLNFRNPNFLKMLGAIKAVEAVRKLYGVDGHIFIAADEILRAAGYDSEGTEQTDPTLLD